MSMKPAIVPHAVEALYNEHHTWLRGWLFRRLRDAADASDLAQDTFVRILSTDNTSPTPVTALHEPRAFLATVARRLLINHIRRQSLEQAYLDTLAALPEAYLPSPEQQMLWLEELQAVDAMLYGLSDKVRAVFVLSQIEGMTYAEIATELSISERSVKRYMAQAMTECIVQGAV
jgi:RNA polymerase sigma factor (sigma-70 family)